MPENVKDVPREGIAPTISFELCAHCRCRVGAGNLCSYDCPFDTEDREKRKLLIATYRLDTVREA